ncbi:MAG: MoaD/ThiS family protein [Chloroflexi bacterium]|nr:MoaD/ThiS family protein [Chloroflexota bacterium]
MCAWIPLRGTWWKDRARGCSSLSQLCKAGRNALVVKVRIPTPLRRLTNGREILEITAADLGQGIESMETQFPGLKERLCDEEGEIRRFVNIYVNGEDVRFLQGLATSLEAGDEVSIVPAVAGG